MTKHDAKRLEQLAKTLEKAMEQAITAKLYLNANEQGIEQAADVNLALEHIQIALERIKKVEVTE